MKKYYLNFILILCFISCEEQLNKAPLDAPSSETFYSTEAELEMALNGVYTGLWWEYSSSIPPMYQILDVATDLAFYRGSMALEDIALSVHTSQTAMFKNTWSHFYKSISKANYLLQNMDRAAGAVPESKLIQIEAETRFLRAFFYHWLIELFGDVPLITSVPSPDEAQLPRSPKSEVYSQIMSDLNFAIQYLPENPTKDKGVATKGAALALKARSALYNQDFLKVIDATTQIIESNTYNLFEDYEKLFRYEGERNEEVILDLPLKIGVKAYEYPQRVGTRNSGTTSAYIPTQFLVDSYQMKDGLPIDQSPLYDPNKPFENRDPRLDASIIRPQSVFMNYVFETHPDSTETWRLTDGGRARVANEDATNAFASYSGYCWRKYLDEKDFPENIRQTELNPIIIRYAEVLLMYAEAKIENNDIDQSVLHALNLVRARGYGVGIQETNSYPAIESLDQKDLRREIQYERKIEFAGEGLRMFDLKRWGIYDRIMNGNNGILFGRPIDDYSSIPSPPHINVDIGYHPEYGSLGGLYRNIETRTFDIERDWLWPIPQEELDINKAIQQNPGY